MNTAPNNSPPAVDTPASVPSTCSASGLRIDFESAFSVRAVFDGHAIHGERDKVSDDWYIRVIAPNGCYSYDGWWKDSGGKSSKAMTEEALRGAWLLPAKELHRFRWWYKGRTPEGVIAKFEGTVQATNEHEAMNAVEKMMRQKHPTIVWMHGKNVEGNGLHYGPTIQMRKTPVKRFATVRCEGDRWDGKRVEIMSGPKGNVWQVWADKEIRAVFTEHFELKQNI